MLNKGRDEADDSFKKNSIASRTTAARYVGRHGQDLGSSNASTILLNLAHRMATLIMAHGFDIEGESCSEED